MKPLGRSPGHITTRRPFTGAWIETHTWDQSASHSVAPSRGRGLKHRLEGHFCAILSRPFTGAWIETAALCLPSLCANVAPSRGRGLKLLSVIARFEGPGRPFTGAWIETSFIAAPRKPWRRRPFTGAWIETTIRAPFLPGTTVAPSRGRGLKHLKSEMPCAPIKSPLHGGVD